MAIQDERSVDQESLGRIRRAQLTGADQLDLSDLDLSSVPESVGDLFDLRTLKLAGNKINAIPEFISRLSNLRILDLSRNRITTIPVSLACLENLERLDLESNWIGTISESFARRATIPASFARLTNLKYLNLSSNQIESIPDFFGALTRLEFLHLSDNHITEIPAEVARLARLQLLNLCDNRISVIPDAIVRLGSLREFWVRGNQITGIPVSLAQLSSLEKLDIELNPIPVELLVAVRQGTDALFRYLNKLEKRKVQPRTVKLVLLGEPKSGKTTLLEALKGNTKPCDPTRLETIGVDIVALAKTNPDDQDTMYLTVWDFAGQHIEHATHQFFLTENAIFIIMWNARQGTEAGKRDLWYWLELLKMRVKEPKYLLVATHVEHTPPDLNLAEIERAYPGLEGQFPVEFESLAGFAALESQLLALAAASPAMRAEWPAAWLPVRDDLRKLRAEYPYVSPKEFKRLLARRGIADETSQRDVTNQLHSLGEILYFQEREELSRLVILNPEWVAELIALIVRSKEVRICGGILSRSALTRLWESAEFSPEVQDHLICLMDWFDLTYSTEHKTDIGIVVEALPFSTLAERKEIELPPGRPQMEMIFRFPTFHRHLPPGIPTWAIARAHRLSKCRPWADAAAFEDVETGSQALILASSMKKEVRLLVAADYPPFFFGRMEAILRDTFKRYPGVEPERRLPCRCRRDCPHSYRYETVLKRFGDRQAIVTCDDSGSDVQIAALLTGFLNAEPPGTEAGLRALQGELRRGFTAQLQALREQSEKTCPSVFTLVPAREFRMLDTWIESLTLDDELELVLYCEDESGWHPTKDGLYRFRTDKVWFDSMKQNWDKLLSVTRRVAPLAKTIGLAASVPWADAVIGTLEKLPETSVSLAGKLSTTIGDRLQPEPIDFEARHLLQRLIIELDGRREATDRTNGGLLPWLTDDGRKLWLCSDHIKGYKARG
jgi:internalin A